MPFSEVKKKIIEQEKEAKKPAWRKTLDKIVKSLKEAFKMLGYLACLIIAPYIIAIVASLFKTVVCGTLNFSDFASDSTINGVEAINNFYFGILENTRDLVFRLTH